MRHTSLRRSLFITIVGLLYLGVASLHIAGFVVSQAWNANSYHWHSDAMWAREYVPATLESARLSEAQHRAQLRYEVPMTAAMDALAVATFIASIGLLWRKAWSRVPFIGVISLWALTAVGSTAVASSIGLLDTTSLLAAVILVVASGFLAWKLRSPSIIREFGNAES